MADSVTLQAHPLAWQLIYRIVEASKPGLGKMSTAIRALDAISAVVPVEATLPNPWAAVSAEEKARVEQETGKTFDRTLRITVALSPEQEEFVREKVKHYYENEASVMHGRVLQHFME